jgi:membrane fusion protein (multidrug efflux system)
MADGARRSPKLLRALLGLIVLLLIGGIALRATAPRPEAVAAAGDQAAAIQVRTLAVAAAPVRHRAALSGVLEPRRRVRIFAETNGRVLEAGAEELDAVAADQLLVQVDPLRARVAVERAQAGLTRATSELGLASTSLSRQQSLKEQAVSSDSALDDASNRSRVAEATIRDARAQLEEARDELARKTIRAPFDGVLASFDVELGEYVRVGQELGELLDLATARVTIGLSDRQIVGVRPGQPAEVRIEAYPNESFPGVILRVGVAVRAESRKFPVEIEIENREQRLLPGMVAQVFLDFGDATERIVVPREAVVEEFGLRFVYVVTPGQDRGLVASRRRVALRQLPFDPGRVEVVSGLLAGDRVAVSGVQSLRDGARVRSADVAAPRREPLDGEDS